MGRPAKYPIQEFMGRRFYMRPGVGYYRCDPKYGGEYMHRVVWRHFNGPIGPDDHVHHIDGNPANNAIENLEVMHSSDHARHHFIHDGPHATACQAWLDTIRPKAAEARRHPAVRAKLSEAAKKGAAERGDRTVTCVHCGVEFTCKAGYRRRMFCSRKCNHYARLKSGVDDVERACIQCGASFQTNRYVAASHCSKSCSGRTSAAKRTAARL